MTIEIPEDMLLPRQRRDTTKSSNRLWLLRNLGIHNRNHSQFAEVMEQLIEAEPDEKYYFYHRGE